MELLLLLLVPDGENDLVRRMLLLVGQMVEEERWLPLCAMLVMDVAFDGTFQTTRRQYHLPPRRRRHLEIVHPTLVPFEELAIVEYVDRLMDVLASTATRTRMDRPFDVVGAVMVRWSPFCRQLEVLVLVDALLLLLLLVVRFLVDACEWSSSCFVALLGCVMISGQLMI